MAAWLCYTERMSGIHHHPPRGNDQQTLRWGFILILLFAGVEALGGWWSGSLALLGDAGHMVSDATALGLATVAAWISRQPPSARHSFGLVRAEVVAALFNSLFMLLVVASIVWHAFQRLQNPQPVNGELVMLIATLGLIVNIIVATLLHRGEQTLNIRAALLHVMGDLLGSVAALVAGVVIYFTAWWPIDPLLSLLICALIMWSSLRLLRDVLHVIMQGVPAAIDLGEVEQTIKQIDEVDSVHGLHIWTLASGTVVLSAHVVMHDLHAWEAVLAEIQALLQRRYGITHVTLQPESSEGCQLPLSISIE